jgi:diguanylate cyclase (GGDEF)-like protein/PAS domain S-box-containing protein
MMASRILVVEDERIVALNLQQRLIKLGYEVPAIVASGEHALQKMQDLRPDLVLMDINIEGPIDGIETAARIPNDLNIPVIYLTAYSEDATLERARGTKPYGYLVKPFSERALHATIQMVLERRSTDLALQDSEERLRLALEAAEMGSWELDVLSRKLMSTGTTDELFGFSSEFISGTWDALLNRVYFEDRAMVTSALDNAIMGESSCQIEFRSVRPSGELRWLRVQGKVFHARRDIGAHRIIGVVQDISDRKIAEQNLRQAATVFSASPDGILVLDKDLRILTANHSYCEITGEELEEVIGKQPHQLSSKLLPPQSRREILKTLQSNGTWTGDLRGLRKSGEHFPLLANIAAVRDEHGELTHYVVVFSDLSAVRNAEQKLYHLAHHDPLTGLPNRLLARDRLETALDRAKRRQSRIALLFIDLDYFKRVNDTLGHNVGDELLRTIAKRLQDCVRQEDTVARLGGDEFMVMLDRIERIEEVVIVTEKIIAALGLPMHLEGRELSISASVGISLFPDDAGNRDDLIRAADTAMYTAKGQGRNRYTFYTAKMTAAAIHYMELDQDLRRGLKQNELVLHYQPQIDMLNGQIIGVEALIRWQHPTKGLVGALDIIPIAEESGLIVEIGEWVLRRACEQAREWRDAGLPPLRIAVNVSARQMYQDRLISVIKTIFSETEMPPGQLEIEITESTLQSEEACLATLQALKSLGVTLAIDDFGTGYSCLSSLKNLPIHRVKIDRAFVRDIPQDLNDVAIAEAIIAMAHRLHLQVIAEGVETSAQEELLRSQGCDEAQGYLYAKPLSAAALIELLNTTPTDKQEHAVAARRSPANKPH